MTVIAYRDGVMAADGRVTSKDFILRDNDKKVFKLKDGSLLGMAGSVVGCVIIQREVERAVKDGKKAKVLSLPSINVKNAEALLVGPGGEIWFFSSREWERIPEPYTAIGAGYLVAMTALDYGASAEEACKYVCKRVSSCGGKIRVVKLDAIH